MSTTLETPPTRHVIPAPAFDPSEPFGGIGSLRRFTVAEYHKLIDFGFFAEDERYELLDGYIVHKRRRDPTRPYGGMIAQRRFTVAEYHTLIEVGFFGDDERLELLDGYLVLNMPQNSPHAGSSGLLEEMLRVLLPNEFFLRGQKPVTLPDSEPEPDIAVVRGPGKRYLTAHSTPAEIAMIVEVSDTTLRTDLREKVEKYGEAGIAEYWVVNVEQRQIEVYTRPQNGAYAETTVYAAGASVPVVLDGNECGTIAVSQVF